MEGLKLTKTKLITLKIRLRIPQDEDGQKKQLAEIIGIAPGTRFSERFLNRFVFEIPNWNDKIKVKDIYEYLEQSKTYHAKALYHFDFRVRISRHHPIQHQQQHTGKLPLLDRSAAPVWHL